MKRESGPALASEEERGPGEKGEKAANPKLACVEENCSQAENSADSRPVATGAVALPQSQSQLEKDPSDLWETGVKQPPTFVQLGWSRSGSTGSGSTVSVSPRHKVFPTNEFGSLVPPSPNETPEEKSRRVTADRAASKICKGVCFEAAYEGKGARVIRRGHPKLPVEWRVRRNMWKSYPPLKYAEQNDRYEDSWEFEESPDIPNSQEHLLGYDGTANRQKPNCDLLIPNCDLVREYVYTGIARSYCLLAIRERLLASGLPWFYISDSGYGGAPRDVLRIDPDKSSCRDVKAIRALIRAYSPSEPQCMDRHTVPKSIQEAVRHRLYYRENMEEFRQFMER